MKKTLVAVAALAAVTGAMAEVTITGFVDGGVQSTKSTTTAGVSSTTTSVGSNGAGQSQLTFAASEDLGSGTTAFANIRLNPGIFSATIGQDVSEIGLRGAFGTALVGRDYGIDFLTHAAADASGWTSGAKGVVHNTSSSTGNAVVYILPTFVEGLGIVLARGLAGNAGGNGDTTSYKFTYKTGGFMGEYAAYTTTTTSTSTWATNFTIGSTTATTDSLAAGGNTKGTALALTYDLGVAKLHGGMFGQKASADGDQKSSSYMYGVSAPFGATTLGLTISAADRTSSAAATKKATGYRVKAAYSFSKRTSGYAAYGSESASSTTAKDTQTMLGLIHNF
ncbi:MAG: porin [Burkholderiales bacterium]|nr:porin [Burkholderiales bacterium]